MISTSSDCETTVRAAFVHLSDEALVAQIARGDEQALGAFYDRFGRTVTGMIDITAGK